MSFVSIYLYIVADTLQNKRVVFTDLDKIVVFPFSKVVSLTKINSLLIPVPRQSSFFLKQMS